MASRQELKKDIERNLSKSGYFMKVHVEGDLDTEWGTLYIEYQRNPKQKGFRNANKILKERLELVIETYFSSGIVSQYEGPNDIEIYRAVFGRQPSEAMREESTDEFLKRANEHFRDRYLFEK